MEALKQSEENKLNELSVIQDSSMYSVLQQSVKVEGNELHGSCIGVNIAGVLEQLEPKEKEGKLKSNNLSSDNKVCLMLDSSHSASHKMFKIINDKPFSEVNGNSHSSQIPDLLTSTVISRYQNVDFTSKLINSFPKEENQDLAIVKFHIVNNMFIASAFKLSANVKHIKECLADVLELDGNLFFLNLDGREVNEVITLDDFGLKSLQKITFDVQSRTGKTGDGIIINKVDTNIPTLSVITVHCSVGGIIKDIIVEIEDQSCEKEWLGGYRNLKTNTDYHRAGVQTKPKLRETVKYLDTGKEYLLFHRDTQTPHKPKNIILDTVNNKATQMGRSDLFIASKTDRILLSKPYIDFGQYCININIEKSVIIIQRAVRNWICGKELRKIIRLQRELLDDMKRQKAKIRKEEADNERVIITGAAYPVKRDDFYMLYLMVGNWWKKEWKRINETRSNSSKQAEVVALLQRHVKLLQEIERHKTIGKMEALKKERMRFLNQMARPVTFKNSKGVMTSIDDMKTYKAREFKEIYCALIRKEVPSKDRMELLLVLKNLISDHYMDYEYADDLVSLIKREIALLTSGFKMADLKGLQMRIEQLFMNFLENEEYNPKAATYKKPNMPKTFHMQFQCFRCNKLLPVSKFPVHVRMKRYNEGGCESCTWMHNVGHQRVDMSPFLKLIKQVRNSEMEKCCYSAVCFIFQPIGMEFLTMKIWHGHSAISECSDISKLQHVRWLHDVEWAPWNTILLTNQEAKCHTSVPDVLEFYDQSFIDGVRQKHILARASLKPLLLINHDLCSSGVWANAKDEGVYLHPSHAEVFAEVNDYDKI